MLQNSKGIKSFVWRLHSEHKYSWFQCTLHNQVLYHKPVDPFLQRQFRFPDTGSAINRVLLLLGTSGRPRPPPQFPHNGSVACIPRNQLRTPRSDGDHLEAALGTSPLHPHPDGSPRDRIRCLTQDRLLRTRIRSWLVPIATIWFFISERFLYWGTLKIFLRELLFGE